MGEKFYRYTYAAGDDAKKLFDYLNHSKIAFNYEMSLFSFVITRAQEVEICKITGAVYSHN